MIVEENTYGDILMRIPRALFGLLAEHLGAADQSRMVFLLERMPVKTVAKLERLALEDGDLARNHLRAAVSQFPPYPLSRPAA